MSRLLIETFFPSFTAILRQACGPLWHRLFPDDVAQLCPEVRLPFVRRPWLALAATLGAVVGVGGRRLRNGGKGGGNNDTDESESMEHIYWSRASVCFGAMNAVALVHHCLAPLPLPPSDDGGGLDWRSVLDVALWALDCLFTGLSSVALCGVASDCATIGEGGGIDGRVATGGRFGLTTRAAASTTVAATAGAAIAVASSWGVPFIDDVPLMTLLLELFYLVPTLLASAAFVPLLVADVWFVFGGRGETPRAPASAGACIALAGMLLSIGGVIFDAPLCRLMARENGPGAPLLDLFTAPVLVFVGCDVAFLGFRTWLNNRRRAALKEMVAQKPEEAVKELVPEEEDITGNGWRCACEGGFLPPGMLKSFGGAEAMLRLGTGQCYHKM